MDWNTLSENVTFNILDITSSYNKEDIYNILLLGSQVTGKSTFVNSFNYNFRELNHLPHIKEGIEISIVPKEDKLFYFWVIRTNLDVLYQLEDGLNEIDGIIGIFNQTNLPSYKELILLISELLINVDVIKPLLILGNMYDKYQNSVKTTDVIDFTKEIGNRLCHKIPYIEFSSLKDPNLMKIINHLINMINCELKSSCARFPVEERSWCPIPSHHVNYLNVNSKLIE